ncbi:helix-turn-helix domain-containing protein [Desulfobacter sp.]|uniref:helix-turn-helix domain-containing protein n=1 Tax=Desulfobacter sp. TaxID=2294 RepID=UPI003D0A6216
MGLTDQNKLFNFKPSCNTGTDCDNGFQAGGHQEIYIRPGLWMSMINFFSDTPVCLEYEKQYPVIDFGFVISGGIKKQTVHANCGPKQMRVKNGSSGVRVENRQTGMFTIPGAAKQQILHLHMTLPFFRSLVKLGDTVLPLEMQAILKSASQIEFVNIRPMTPDIQTVVYQLLNRSSNAFPWPLYLEGKSLELLCLHLAALGLDHCRSPQGQSLSPDEKQNILKARDLLVADLQSPPSLEKLSKMTCMTPAKLQAGFRQIYGKSVFNYFREYRMQKAMQLLDETRTNVSQTAWHVGYTNVSHFSEAFRKRFGILPKQYLKNRPGLFEG